SILVVFRETPPRLRDRSFEEEPFASWAVVSRKGDPDRLDRRVLVNDVESRGLLDPSLTTIAKYRRLRLGPARNTLYNNKKITKVNVSPYLAQGPIPCPPTN
ncbi:hypothetical protein T310_5527, partial [Rasamsonia emersonii CBS 393.64]